MDQASQASRANADNINAAAIAMVGFLGIIVVFAIVLILEVIYYRVAASQDEEKSINEPFVELDRMVATQQERLGQYRVVDRRQGIFAIPVDRAMELVVRQYQRPGAAETLPSIPAAGKE